MSVTGVIHTSHTLEVKFSVAKNDTEKNSHTRIFQRKMGRDVCTDSFKSRTEKLLCVLEEGEQDSIEKVSCHR